MRICLFKARWQPCASLTEVASREVTAELRNELASTHELVEKLTADVEDLEARDAATRREADGLLRDLEDSRAENKHLAEKVRAAQHSLTNDAVGEAHWGIVR